MSRKATVSIAIITALAMVVSLALFGCGKASAKPEIKSLDPVSGAPGSEVVVKGGTFGATQGAGVVFFSGKEVAVVAWSDTVITVKIPADMAEAAYGVKVETEQGASNEVEFRVIKGDASSPRITSLVPDNGKPGGEVVIGGSAFGEIQADGKVLFGTGQAEVTRWSDTSITIKVPANLGPNTYGVTVETSEGKSNEAIFKIGGDEDKLEEQKQAIVAYLQSQGQSTAGSDKWAVSLTKKSAQDPSWEVVTVTVPAGTSFKAVLVFNNMLAGWECLKTGQPPWTGVEFKGEPVPSDLENA